MDIHKSIDSKNTIAYSLFIYQQKFQAYVEDDNGILIEDDILEYMGFNVFIFGTTTAIVDAENLVGRISLEKNIFKIRTGAQETHELC